MAKNDRPTGLNGKNLGLTPQAEWNATFGPNGVSPQAYAAAFEQAAQKSAILSHFTSPTPKQKARMDALVADNFAAQETYKNTMSEATMPVAVKDASGKVVDYVSTRLTNGELDQIQKAAHGSDLPQSVEDRAYDKAAEKGLVAKRPVKETLQTELANANKSASPKPPAPEVPSDPFGAPGARGATGAAGAPGQPSDDSAAKIAEDNKSARLSFDGLANNSILGIIISFLSAMMGGGFGGSEREKNTQTANAPATPGKKDDKSVTEAAPDKKPELQAEKSADKAPEKAPLTPAQQEFAQDLTKLFNKTGDAVNDVVNDVAKKAADFAQTLPKLMKEVGSHLPPIDGGDKLGTLAHTAPKDTSVTASQGVAPK